MSAGQLGNKPYIQAKRDEKRHSIISVPYIASEGVNSNKSNVFFIYLFKYDEFLNDSLNYVFV